MDEQELDEKFWYDEQRLREVGGTIHTNTVLPYFYMSVFFDHTSNNAIVHAQALSSPWMRPLIEFRENFENHLRTMNGLEYMVTHDPSQNGRLIDPSGAWVIRKQQRRKRPGEDDEIIPLTSYVVLNGYVFVAPSLGSVIASRLLAASKHLTNAIQSVSSLANFSASGGHTYLRETSDRTEPEREDSMSATKAAAPLPKLTPLRNQPPVADDAYGAGLLARSLQLSDLYENEFMDEMPLQGEPGSFVMRKSRLDNTLVKPSQTPKPATPLPPPIQTAIENPMGKGSKGSEKSPITPGGSKKRKKSRVASTTTPK